jgi:hypothetical protein
MLYSQHEFREPMQKLPKSKLQTDSFSMRGRGSDAIEGRTVHYARPGGL